MADNLTPEQREAVYNRGGKLLISAAAGSGKTKVLVDRLLSYILDASAPANIDDFLIITYTKAAASELRGKIASKISEHIAQDPGNMHLQRQLQRLYLAKISTVHAFCADLLREYAYKLDFGSDFRVGDETECVQLRMRAVEQVLDEAYEASVSDSEFLAFADTQGLGRNDRMLPEIIQSVYDSAKCHLDYNQWLDDCLLDAAAHGITDAGKTVWGRYLMDDLFITLDQIISAMKKCLNRLARMDGMEKPMAVFQTAVSQLTYLRESETWDEIIERKSVDFGSLRFPKKYDDQTITTPIKTVRSECKDLLSSKLRLFSDPSCAILSDISQTAMAAKGLIKLVRNFEKTFDALKRSCRILDFSDLEHKTLDLLLGKRRNGPTLTADEVGKRFREIMVDEYQDSNEVQDAIFSALSHKRQNLFMVGDVKQSIYQFRLADPGIFIEKYETFAHACDAQPGEGRKILLSKNFRSSGGVISAVNSVFRDCMSKRVGGLVYTEDEALKEGIPHIQLPDTEVEFHAIEVQESTYDEEADFVAKRITELLDGRHMVRNKDTLRLITPEDIVILLRSPGSVGHKYVQALEQAGISCYTGNGADLLETEEISAIRSLLQVIDNPRQDIPLVAALASPLFSFSADDLAAFRSQNRDGYIYDALKAWDDPKGKDFLSKLDALRNESRMATLPELLEKIMLLTNAESVYRAMPGGEERVKNIESFYASAVQFEGNGPKDLSQFLTYLDSLADRGLMNTQDNGGSGAVTLMSIHKSKGLEFPVVFLCGLSRRFNKESLYETVLCEKELGLGMNCVDQEKRYRYPTISKQAIARKMEVDGLSEELRVLYVAMTRACDRLIMTYASQNLRKELTELAHLMDYCDRELITANAPNPGQWALYSVLQKTESGALFAISDKPSETKLSDVPWKITFCDRVEPPASEMTQVCGEDDGITESLIDQIRTGLSFRYQYPDATSAPSKQTATQKKGREKDKEAAEFTKTPPIQQRTWRKPAFAGGGMDGKTYGTAIHTVMQYIRFEVCQDADSVQKEIDRLVQQRFITAEAAVNVDRESLLRFFTSDVGIKLRNGKKVLREFKFSILDDANGYGQNLDGERVLLQGVVDCALVEDDGITIIDFKTDRVKESTIEKVKSSYRTQIEVYAQALSRIFELPIKGRGLYFFQLDRIEWL